jgi:predicted phage tail protein
VSGTVVDLFRTHTVWAQLDDLDAVLGRTAEKLASLDPREVSIHGSLCALAGYTRSLLDGANSILIPSNTLDPLAAAIAQCTSHIKSFEESGDPSYLSAAWTNATPILNAVSALPIIKARRDTRGLATAISSFEDKLIADVEQVSARAEQFNTSLDDLQTERNNLATEIEEQRGKLAQAIDTFSTQFTADQEARQEQYTSTLNAAKEELATAHKQGEEFYDQDEARHIEQIAKFKTTFGELTTDIKTAAETAAQAHAEQAAEIITDLEEQLTQAKHLVEMIGEVTMTGHYQRNASEQKKVADQLRWATIIVGVLAIVSAVVSTVLGIMYRERVEFFDFFTHATVTVALGGLATFLASQSHRHRVREEEYRSLELELATLDPFLNSLDEEERQRIKTELAMRYFKGVDRDVIKHEEVPVRL